MSGTGETGSGRDRGAAERGRRSGAIRPQLRDRLAVALSGAGFDLEDVAVTKAGARSLVRVVVDRDGGIDLDAVADASRTVSELLDAAEAAGDALIGGPYVLEVTSPGVDRPLTAPRHWRRAVGRLVTIRDLDGGEVSGRVLSADEAGADLSVPVGPARRGRPARHRTDRVLFERVARATVEVEFTATEYDDLNDAPSAAPVPTPGAAMRDDLDLPASPGQVTNNEGRQVDAQGAAGEEMTR
ncbi:Ribosome maturation factor RimP [Frankia sp. AiPs1]|uniref:ribosome maturation factor RimP n=1 Tax=Frankia sp. AiPa1 TaxID=573492 RepID=UPI00202B2265|nr:ribosome maturation factor RimP [Frankia sp. AiPa1]MCL9761514.1 ribosome maturation factor RimP [Frankia sp. AiPa1]